MKGLPKLQFSDAAVTTGRVLPVALLVGREVAMHGLERAVESRKERALEFIRSAARGEIERRMAGYGAFFVLEGFNCPLPGQLRTVERKGFPRISPCVDALLVCEMTSGLLMGVQDLDALGGDIVYDIAEGGETFEGLRSTVTCRPGEIVLRDGRSVIASYFQGPNRRINVTPKTTSVLFFIFSAPGLDLTDVEAGLAVVADIVEPNAEATEVRIFDGVQHAAIGARGRVESRPTNG